ncbi:hypothetical protein LIER_34708 [Lithospermum erythrorhizon]|uniref:Uncharacterized protein n=1 Tax=Lithospermum erythrorhizon TaxID=34254 RepID=A0AAV3S2K6_LITER
MVFANVILKPDRTSAAKMGIVVLVFVRMAKLVLVEEMFVTADEVHPPKSRKSSDFSYGVAKIKTTQRIFFAKSGEFITVKIPQLPPNQKDEIQIDSSTQNITITLQSLGITNGDLIFFTFNPLGFNSCFQDSTFMQSRVENELVMEKSAQVTPESSIFEQIRDAQKGEIVGKGTQIAPEFSLSQEIRDVQKEKIVEDSTQITSESSLSLQIRVAQKEEIVKMDRNLVVDEADGDDVDEDGEGSVDVDVGSVAKSFSIPGFLMRMLTIYHRDLKRVGVEAGRGWG